MFVISSFTKILSLAFALLILFSPYLVGETDNMEVTELNSKTQDTFVCPGLLLGEIVWTSETRRTPPYYKSVEMACDKEGRIYVSWPIEFWRCYIQSIALKICEDDKWSLIKKWFNSNKVG